LIRTLGLRSGAAPEVRSGSSDRYSTIQSEIKTKDSNFIKLTEKNSPKCFRYLVTLYMGGRHAKQEKAVIFFMFSSIFQNLITSISATFKMKT
jgi:hypothetical protein